LERDLNWRMFLWIIIGRLSVFTACSLTSGGIVGLIWHIRGDGELLAFVFGSFLPTAPLLLYFSSTWALRRGIEGWKKLQTDEVITKLQFSRLRQTAVDWYSQRWYGPSATPPAQGGEDEDKEDGSSAPSLPP
jgi:hypothetical protein